MEQEYWRDWPETAIRRALLHPAILTEGYSGEQNMFLYRIFSENHELCSWSRVCGILVCTFIIITVYVVN